MGTLAKRNSTSHINPSNAQGVILVDPSGSTPFGTTAPVVVRVRDGATGNLTAVESIAGDALAAATLAMRTSAAGFGFNGTTWDRLRAGTADNSAATGIQNVLLQIRSAVGGNAIYIVPSDQIADANNGTRLLPQHGFAFNGATWDRIRTPNVFKPFSVTVASLGTGQTVWTPASNKRFRLLGFAVTSDKAAQVNFKDGSVATIFSTPAVVAATPFGVSGIGNGMLSASANNLLALDVSASVPVVLTGTVWGTEE